MLLRLQGRQAAVFNQELEVPAFSPLFDYFKLSDLRQLIKLPWASVFSL